ncbi:MAG TPA: hypothetical protein VIL34_01595 [Actinopolymorphaceae bacterium]|jgi:hypothetical protein
MSSFVTSLAATVVAEAPHRELPAPSLVYGIGVFAVMLVLLLITLGFGKGRPHA